MSQAAGEGQVRPGDGGAGDGPAHPHDPLQTAESALHPRDQRLHQHRQGGERVSRDDECQRRHGHQGTEAGEGMEWVSRYGGWGMGWSGCQGTEAGEGMGVEVRRLGDGMGVEVRRLGEGMGWVLRYGGWDGCRGMEAGRGDGMGVEVRRLGEGMGWVSRYGGWRGEGMTVKVRMLARREMAVKVRRLAWRGDARHGTEAGDERYIIIFKRLANWPIKM